MEKKNRHPQDGRYKVVFLFPEVLRPLKANFAGEFEFLSEYCTGYIFTLCSESYDNLQIGAFRLYSRPLQTSGVRKFLNRLWIQVCVPVWLLGLRPKIDAVITWDPYASGLSGIILKLLFRAKLIVQVVGDYHKMDPTEDILGDPDQQNRLVTSLKKWVMKSVFCLAIWSADAVKVVNTDLESFFRRRWPRKPVYRFQCFVANKYFRSLENHQGDYLLTIGFPFYRKGVDIVIRAFTALSKKHETMKLRIMGYATEEEIKKHKRMGNDDPRIEFVKPGWIEDVGEQLRKCYALVHAARSDAAPRVLFEAMACKKPVVATRTNGGIDYIENGRTGLLCDIDNVEELSQKLEYLLSNPGIAVTMGKAGFEKAQAEFSEVSYVQRVVSMLKDVIER
jgi:glycosyltransferase involved in cell wall biosynthesis